MIYQEQLVTTLTSAFPQFIPDAAAVDLPYVVLGDFARFVIDIYESGDETERIKAIQLIELLHTDGDTYVREAATIGLIEAIQNSWKESGAIPHAFEASLLPESRQWWNSLNTFWRGGIPYVGADTQK